MKIAEQQEISRIDGGEGSFCKISLKKWDVLEKLQTPVSRAFFQRALRKIGYSGGEICVKTNGSSSTDVIQLRQLLAQRFPGMRNWAENTAAPIPSGWPTGLPQLDALLQNGLPKGAITELVSAKSAAGSAMVLRAILRQAYESRQLIALIDGNDSFDATTLPQPVLSRLLWARCQSAEQALKAADIILRDRNLPVVILDLKMNPITQTKKITATTWYRLQRLAQPASTALLVLSARPMVGNADARVTLENRFGLPAMSQNEPALLAQLKFDLIRWALGEQTAGIAS